MTAIWGRSVTAELSWLTPQGPVGIPVVPLVWPAQDPTEPEERPCVALPLAHLDVIDTLTDGLATLSVTDGATRETGFVATGHVTVTPDIEGVLFAEHLVEQECYKHPPSRLRVDSLMARRENWWWMARMIVTFVSCSSEREIPARRKHTDALVVHEEAHRPRVDMVEVGEWPRKPGAQIEVQSPSEVEFASRASPAYLFGHQHSPDFERWERWYRSGELAGTTMTVAAASGDPEADPQPFRLFSRLRNHWDVSRACRAGIAIAEHRGLRG